MRHDNIFPSIIYLKNNWNNWYKLKKPIIKIIAIEDVAIWVCFDTKIISCHTQL